MDEADIAGQNEEFLRSADIGVARAQAAKIPAGVSGECEKCGDESPRLVLCDDPKDGKILACARCRDERNLPVCRNQNV